MSLDLDPNFDRRGARAVTLAGREFLVAPLPLRHVLAIADLVPRMKDVKRAEDVTGDALMPLVEVVRRGLLKAHPGVTTDDLLDMPIKIEEMMAAFPVVVEQAGGQRSDPAGGEGASRSTQSTGNGSSPASSSTSPAGPETRF